MIERLQRLRAAITTHRSQPASERSASPLGSPGLVVGASQGSARSVGANAAFGLGGPPAKTGATERGKRLLPLPAIPGPPYWLPALLALLACGLLLIVAARRRVLPATLRGALAEHGGAQLSALAVTVGLILVVAVAFMIQALLP